MSGRLVPGEFACLRCGMVVSGAFELSGSAAAAIARTACGLANWIGADPATVSRPAKAQCGRSRSR
jgi:hypothetical protein